MTEPGQGLRFDVYERVQLPVDVADIRALEEIELTPYISVHHENGQVVLRGHLLLAGLYEGGEEDGQSRTLEHWIPVEISLPASRVNEQEGVAVEIENFDVDLLAPRTLNITGVLSLRGVEVRRETTQPSWQEEPFNFVHRPGESGSSNPYYNLNLSPTENQGQAAYTPAVPAPFYSGPGYSPPLNTAPVTGSGASGPDGGGRESGSEGRLADAGSETVTGYGSEAQTGYGSEVQTGYGSEARTGYGSEAQTGYGSEARTGYGSEAQTGYDSEAVTGYASEAEPALEDEQERQSYAESWQQTAEMPAEADSAWDSAAQGVTAYAPAPEAGPEGDLETLVQSGQETTYAAFGGYAGAQAEQEPDFAQESAKNEMKIAVAAQKPETGDGGGAAGLLTLLPKTRDGEPAAPNVQPAAVQADAGRRPSASGDDIQWRNLFLRSREEDQDFRKVRMCIVQREETLETIAGRYRLNPRELQIYNRLDDEGVREGQVLYIP